MWTKNDGKTKNHDNRTSENIWSWHVRDDLYSTYKTKSSKKSNQIMFIYFRWLAAVSPNSNTFVSKYYRYFLTAGMPIFSLTYLH